MYIKIYNLDNNRTETLSHLCDIILEFFVFDD